MRILSTLAIACLLTGCEPVNFAKREGLSVVERARAMAVLQLNAKALNAGDIDALERTIHPDSSELVEDAQGLIERFAPTVALRGLKVVSEKAGEIVVEYEQTASVKHGALPFSSTIVQTTLLSDGGRWGIYSTRLVRLIP